MKNIDLPLYLQDQNDMFRILRGTVGLLLCNYELTGVADLTLGESGVDSVVSCAIPHHWVAHVGSKGSCRSWTWLE